jgi:nucleoside-diphosphate-sugar epimerase
MPTSKLSTTNKKVLILGAGYLGQRLISPLCKQGYLVDTVTRSSRLNSQEIHQHYFCSPEHDSLSNILKASQPDLIVICWAPGSRSNANNTYQKTYWDRLIELRLALFQDHRPKQIIYTGSTSVYEDQDGSLKSESDPLVGQHERSQVLIQAEQEVQSWAAKFQLISQVLRLSGIFGPDRTPGLRLLKNSSPIPGNGNAFVNLVHVDDIVSAVLKALDHRKNGLWNISALTTSRYELYEHIAKIHGLNEPTWETLSQSDLGRRINAQAAQKDLGWSPIHTNLSQL